MSRSLWLGMFISCQPQVVRAASTSIICMTLLVQAKTRENIVIQRMGAGKSDRG